MKLQRRTPRLLIQITLFSFSLNAALPAAYADPKKAETPAKAEPAPAAAADGKGEPEKKAENTKVTLCGPKGHGAMVSSWPAEGDAKYNEVERHYKTKMEDIILRDGSKFHQMHALEEALRVRRFFFHLAFGDASAVIQICNAKRKMAAYLTKFTEAREKKAKESGTSAICSEADRAMEVNYTEAKKAYDKLANGIEVRLSKGFKVDGSGQEIHSLEKAFKEGRAVNRLVVEKNIDPIKLKSESYVSLLKMEYENLWGKGSYGRVTNVTDNSLDLGGLYSDVVDQTRHEKREADDRRKDFEAQKVKFEAAKKRCEGVPMGSERKSSDLTKAGGPGAPAPAKGDGKTPALSGAAKGAEEKTQARSGGCKPDPSNPELCEDGTIRKGSPDTAKDDPASPEARDGGDDATKSAAQRRREEAERKKEEAETKRREAEESRAATAREKGGDSKQTDEFDPDKPKNNTKKPTSNFLKDNWPWLVGGAAVVGGGAYLLHKKKKDDRRREREEDEMMEEVYANRPVHQHTVTVNETIVVNSPNGVTAPAGAKLIITQAVGNVNQGDTMPKIEIVLTDSGGTPLTLNDLVVEAGCLTPQPCSLTGTKTVKTVNGRATFEALVFNQAHTGVKLQFSAPGTQIVATPAPFDVLPTDVLRNQTKEVVY